MVQKFKEGRIYLGALILISSLLPYFTMKTDVENEYASASNKITITGITAMQYNFLGIVTLLIPIVIIAFNFYEQEKIEYKQLCLGCGIFGIMMMVVTMLLVKSAAMKTKSSAGGIETDAELKSTLNVGFWLMLAGYIGIVIYTVIKDYVLNKDISELNISMNKLNASELTGMISNVKDNIGQVAADKMTKKCPDCGADVIIGKKFCSKCGASVGGDIFEKIKKTTEESSKLITVEEYIAQNKGLTCKECGEIIDSSKKFCAGCGKEVVIEITPTECISCGTKIINGKKYCVQCGTGIKPILLSKKCKKCDSDLYFMKAFCPECGEKNI